MLFFINQPLFLFFYKWQILASELQILDPILHIRFGFAVVLQFLLFFIQLSLYLVYLLEHGSVFGLQLFKLGESRPDLGHRFLPRPGLTQ